MTLASRSLTGLVLAVSLLAGRSPLAAPPPAEDGDWQARAAVHLDERARAWLERAPQVHQNFQCAMSCHTTQAYLLARPLVAASSTVTSPTYRRVRDAIEARVTGVRDWKSEAIPMYGHRAGPGVPPRAVRRAAESVGTEAVLNAATLVLADLAAGGKLTPVAERALANLWQVQRSDGGWDWLDFGLEPWEARDTWGAALVALAVGSIPGYADDAAHRARVGQLVAFLRARRSDGRDRVSLHEEVMILWAASALRPLLDDGERAALIAKVTRAQRSDGGWSLATWGRGERARKDAPSDGYATAYALVALCRSGERGAPVDNGLAWLRAHQRSDGSWPGASVNSDAAFNQLVMSDAATAYATLALTSCRR